VATTGKKGETIHNEARKECGMSIPYVNKKRWRKVKCNHLTLRLPPYTCDLSPIELDWAKVKYLIRPKNVGAEFTLNGLRKLTDLE
jgi:transposase